MWIAVQYPQTFSYLYSLISIYFLLAWLDAVYRNFKYGEAIPKSLIFWHIEFFKHLKNIPQILGWKKSCLLLFIFTVSILFFWKFLSKPDFDQLSPIRSSLKQIQISIKEISDSNNNIKDGVKRNDEVYIQIFQNYSNVVSDVDNLKSSTDTNVSELSTNVSELNTSFISEINRLGDLKTELSKNQGKLKSLPNIISQIKISFQSVCSTNDIQTKLKCQELTGDITQYEKYIFDQKPIIDNFINEELVNIETNYKKIADLRKTIGTIEEKIEKAKGIDQKQKKQWITDSEIGLNELAEKISNYSNKNYALEFNEIEQNLHKSRATFLNIEKSIMNLENQKDVIAVIHDVNFNQNKIQKLEKYISKIPNILDKLIHQLSDDLEELRNFRVQAYGYAVQANSYLQILQGNSQEQQDKNLISIRYNRSKNITSNIDHIINQYQIDFDKINNQKEILSIEIGEFTSNLKSLKIKNSEIQRQAILGWIILFIAFVVASIIIILIGLLFVRNSLEQRQLDEQEKLNKDNRLNTLLECVIDSKRTLRIRSYAVKKIYNPQVPLEENEIKQIKDLINNLEKSRSNNDKIVAAKLRIVAEAHELRFAERRRL